MKKRRLLIISVLILLVVDFIILTNLSLGSGRGLTGEVYSPEEVLKKGYYTLFFGLPFLSVIIGSLISLFTIKKKRFTEQILQNTLITLGVFYILLLIVGIRNILLW